MGDGGSNGRPGIWPFGRRRQGKQGFGGSTSRQQSAVYGMKLCSSRPKLLSAVLLGLAGYSYDAVPAFANAPPGTVYASGGGRYAESGEVAPTSSDCTISQTTDYPCTKAPTQVAGLPRDAILTVAAGA